MKKFFPILFLVGLLIGLAQVCGGAATLTTTSAQPATLGAQETFHGLQAVMKSAPGSFVMEKGNLILMAWPRRGEYAFAVLGKTADVACDLNGLKVNTLSLSAMVKSLETDGWKYIAPKAVPAAIADALGALTVEMAMVSMRSLPSVFLVPVALFEPTPVLLN